MKGHRLRALCYELTTSDIFFVKTKHWDNQQCSVLRRLDVRDKEDWRSGCWVQQALCRLVKYMVVSCRIGCYVELALCCVVTDMVVLLWGRTSSVLCGLASV